ncbi:hypothetical protein AB1Y20_003187 [Prymnesium parvum]|uniref:PH domain-containing protein n=1 Tax=Prymnesium parvum TaxID=97485 RepID=A0AB34JB52_PRYPA
MSYSDLSAEDAQQLVDFATFGIGTATVGRRAVKQGWLWKQGGASGALFSRESWKKRWVVLEEKRLIWAADETSLPKGEIYVSGAQVEANPAEVAKKHRFSFAIRHRERTLFAHAESAAEQQLWVQAIQRTAMGDFRPTGETKAVLASRSSVSPASPARPGLTEHALEQRVGGGEEVWWADKLPLLTSTDGGYLLKQGGAKGGARTWKRRFCVLQGGELIYFKDDEQKGVAPVRGARIEEEPPELCGRALGFAIRHPQRTFFACAETKDSLDTWLRALRQCAASTPLSGKLSGGGTAATADEVPDVGVWNPSPRAAPPKRRPPSRGARVARDVLVD